MVYIDKKNYYTHRIIWVMLHKKIPKNVEIDHINRIRTDNRLVNLRAVDRSLNNLNATPRKSVSGHKGIRKRDGKWAVRIKYKGKDTTLGRFTSLDDAIAKRKEAEFQIFQTGILDAG